MIQKIRAWFSHESSAWNVLLFYTALTLVNNIIIVSKFSHLTTFSLQIAVRLLQITVSIILLFLLVKYRHRWTEKIITITFVLLFLPNILNNFHLAKNLIHAGLPWTPNGGIKFQLILLAFLVPGPYKVNLTLMIVMCLEAIFIWFYFDIPHQEHATLVGEPEFSFIYAITAFAILAFRYRDHQLIKKLSEETAKTEVHEKVASIFLSLRDKVNTPLQTQKFSIALLKKRYPEAKDILDPLEKSVSSLSKISEIYARLDKNFPMETGTLMEENEIIEYLEKVEAKKH